MDGWTEAASKRGERRSTNNPAIDQERGDLGDAAGEGGRCRVEQGAVGVPCYAAVWCQIVLINWLQQMLFSAVMS